MTNNNLPIWEARNSFLQAVSSHQTVIVEGSTGCGKTTQLPQFLLDAGFLGQQIACTQPRRVAAIRSADRVSEERGTKLGGEVGYHIRFENKTGRNTKLTFMTGGILLREAISDPLLSKYSCVMVDEAHERDIFSDFLLGYLKQVCVKRPKFKVIVSSATMRYEEFMKYFPDSCLIDVRKREFPVSIRYAPVERWNDIPFKVEELVRDIHGLYQRSNHKQDVLVFLPGEREIKYTLERLQRLQLERVECLPLFGRLDPSEQHKVFMPFDGMKVILATNVAESALTIDGVTYVIDAGLAKAEGFEPDFGVETLTIGKITQAEAIQRAGRAGRTQPGTCIRLYSEQNFRELEEYPVPEITRADITSLVFAMKSLGLGKDFDFITQPNDNAWAAAEKKLQGFGAIDENGRITPHGENMIKFPVDAQLGHFILGAIHYGCVEEAVILSAMLSIGRFFVSEFYDEADIQQVKEKFRDPESDFFTLLNIWDDYQSSGHDDAWCEANHINPYWMRGVRTIREDLQETLRREGFKPTSNRNRNAMGRALLYGFHTHLLCHEGSGGYGSKNGLHQVSIFKDSTLANAYPEYVVASSLKRTANLYAHCLHSIPREWLDEAKAAIPALEVEIEPASVVEDSLLGAFLKQPLSELGLSDLVHMKLWAIDIETVGDLTSRSEKRLLKEISDLLGTQSGADVIREVRDRLRYFDLELAPDQKKRNDFTIDTLIMNLPPATPLNDEQAAKVLGEQFPLFQAFRLAAQEYRALGRAAGTKERMCDARNAIAVLHLGLARKRAQLCVPEMKRLDDPSIDFDDLYQEGCIGLLAGVERFDYTRGFKFSTYGFQWVRQAVTRFLADNSGVPVHMVERLKKFAVLRKQAADKLGHDPNREELAQFSGKSVEEIEYMLTVYAFWIHATSLDEPLTNHGHKGSEGDEGTLNNFVRAPEDSPLDKMEKTQLQEMVAGIFDEVPFLEVEQQCLELYFGLNGTTPHTLEEIGEYLGVTRERVRQRLEEAIKRLRTPRIWEMARKHIKSLPAPPTNKAAKFETQIGDTVDEIVRARVTEEASSESKAPLEPIDPAQLQWNALRIVSQVADHYKVSSEAIFGLSPATNVARARQVGIYRLREELDMSFQQIGDIFNRPHAIVMREYKAIASEVLSGIIPIGCFPEKPQAVIAAANRNGHAPSPPVDLPSTNEQVSASDALDQGVEVLELWPKIEQVLRSVRKTKTLRNLRDLGRDRLLMTDGLDDDAVADIEAALVKQGIQLGE